MRWTRWRPAAAAAIAAIAVAMTAASDGGRGSRGFGRRKVCRYCADKTAKVDHKDANGLKLFVTERGKIIPRRISGNCAKHQREVAVAIKRARMLALLPYTVMQAERGDPMKLILREDVSRSASRAIWSTVRERLRPQLPAAPRTRPCWPTSRTCSSWSTRRRSSRPSRPSSRPAPRTWPSASAAPRSRSPARSASRTSCSARSPRSTSPMRCRPRASRSTAGQIHLAEPIKTTGNVRGRGPPPR